MIWTDTTLFFVCAAAVAVATGAVALWRSSRRRKAERMRRLFIQRLTDAQ